MAISRQEREALLQELEGLKRQDRKAKAIDPTRVSGVENRIDAIEAILFGPPSDPAIDTGAILEGHQIAEPPRLLRRLRSGRLTSEPVDPVPASRAPLGLFDEAEPEGEAIDPTTVGPVDRRTVVDIKQPTAAASAARPARKPTLSPVDPQTAGDEPTGLPAQGPVAIAERDAGLLERLATGRPDLIASGVGDAIRDNPEMTLRLLETLAGIGATFAARGDAKAAQRRLNRGQARSNLLNTLSRRQVAQPPQQVARPGRLTTLLSGAATAASQARQQVERDQEVADRELRLDADLARSDLRRNDQGQIVPMEKKADPNNLGDIFYAGGRAGLSLEDLLKKNSRAMAGVSAQHREQIVSQHAIGIAQRADDENALRKEEVGDALLATADVSGQIHGQSGQGTFQDLLAADSQFKRDYEAANPRQQMLAQAAYNKAWVQSTGEAPDLIEGMEVVAQGLGKNFASISSAFEALKLHGNENLLARYEDMGDLEKAQFEGEFLVARATANSGGRGMSNTAKLEIAEVEAFLRFVEKVEAERFGGQNLETARFSAEELMDFAQKQPLEGPIGNFRRWMASFLPAGWESRSTPDSIAYEEQIALLAAMTARMLNGSRVSDFDYRVAARIVPARNMGEDQTRLQFANLKQLARIRMAAIRGNFDPNLTDYGLSGVFDIASANRHIQQGMTLSPAGRASLAEETAEDINRQSGPPAIEVTAAQLSD